MNNYLTLPVSCINNDISEHPTYFRIPVSDDLKDHIQSLRYTVNATSDDLPRLGEFFKETDDAMENMCLVVDSVSFYFTAFEKHTSDDMQLQTERVNVDAFCLSDKEVA